MHYFAMQYKYHHNLLYIGILFTLYITAIFLVPCVSEQIQSQEVLYTVSAHGV